MNTGAHQTQDLAELVCSNSLGSNLPDRASGLLKNELRLLGSKLLECAEASALPAGGALAVDRELFQYQKYARFNRFEVLRPLVATPVSESSLVERLLDAIS